ncbi:MAG: hypothetical protein ACJ0DG_06375 [bacterium]
MTGALILAVIAGKGLFYHETLKHRKVLQQELSRLEVELEQHINNSPALIYAAREKHLEELEKLAKQWSRNLFGNIKLCKLSCHQSKVHGWRVLISKDETCACAYWH